MSHEIRYLARVFGDDDKKEQIFHFLQKKVENKYTIIEIANSDLIWSPYGIELQKGDFFFNENSKIDLDKEFIEMAKIHPNIDWKIEYWDEEIGLHYIMQNKDGILSAWNIIPTELDRNEEYEPKKEWDDYFSNPLY